MCIFGDSTIVPIGYIIPDDSVVVGRPCRVIRKLTREENFYYYPITTPTNFHLFITCHYFL